MTAGLDQREQRSCRRGRPSWLCTLRPPNRKAGHPVPHRHDRTVFGQSARGWYNQTMAKTLAKPPRSPTKGYTVGRRGFAKISAVEGIQLSSEMEARFREFDRKGLSASERREAIARAFAKVR